MSLMIVVGSLRRFQLSGLVNPADALPSFQKAYEKGELQLQHCEAEKSFFVYADQPNGELRLSYARIEAGQVTALVIYFNVPPINGLPCFQVGWAVPEAFRNQGRARRAVQASLRELDQGFAKRGIIPKFYVEAVVGADNEPSQKVAFATLSEKPEHGIDKFSGEAVLHYVTMIGG